MKGLRAKIPNLLTMKILLLGLLFTSGLTSSIAELELVDSPRYKYMADLQSSIADEQGIPIQTDLAAFPTSVSCLRDLGKNCLFSAYLLQHEIKKCDSVCSLSCHHHTWQGRLIADKTASDLSSNTRKMH